MNHVITSHYTQRSAVCEHTSQTNPQTKETRNATVRPNEPMTLKVGVWRWYHPLTVFGDKIHATVTVILFLHTPAQNQSNPIPLYIRNCFAEPTREHILQTSQKKANTHTRLRAMSCVGNPGAFYASYLCVCVKHVKRLAKRSRPQSYIYSVIFRTTRHKDDETGYIHRALDARFEPQGIGPRRRGAHVCARRCSQFVGTINIKPTRKNRRPYVSPCCLHNCFKIMLMRSNIFTSKAIHPQSYVFSLWRRMLHSVFVCSDRANREYV